MEIGIGDNERVVALLDPFDSWVAVDIREWPRHGYAHSEHCPLGG